MGFWGRPLTEAPNMALVMINIEQTMYTDAGIKVWLMITAVTQQA